MVYFWGALQLNSSYEVTDYYYNEKMQLPKDEIVGLDGCFQQVTWHIF